MKAYVLHGVNDLRYEDVPVPVPRAGNVLVNVMAAGICGSDIPRIYGTGAYFYPLIPGHEFAGVVTETGSGADGKWLGRRVGVFPLMPCGKCAQCQAQRYEMCENYGYLGSRDNGGFAEYVEVPAWNLIALPETVSFGQAAMLEPMAVAVHAIRRSGIAKEHSAAVCGLGAIGFLTILFLQELGCRKILAVGNKPFQKACALKTGLPEENFCDSAVQDTQGWIMERTGGKGADVFFDCAGTNDTLSYALSGAAAGGAVQLVGNPAADMELSRALYSRILRRQLTIKGTWNSSFGHDGKDDWHYVLERLGQGKICPERLVTHRMPFGELQKGFDLMHDKSESYVKVMGIREG